MVGQGDMKALRAAREGRKQGEGLVLRRQRSPGKPSGCTVTPDDAELPRTVREYLGTVQHYLGRCSRPGKLWAGLENRGPGNAWEPGATLLADR